MSSATTTTTPVSVSKRSTTATTPEPRVQKSSDKEPLTTSLPSLADVKDRRAYEHGRQKVKKAADFVKMKTQKARVVIDPSWPRVPSREKEKLVADEEVDSDAVLVDDGRDIVISDVKFDVKLADLIMTRKPQRRNDSDFEVIPHLRSVIVLDDVATHDVSVDEPWEHIFGEDETVACVKAPSYANILGSSPPK